MLFKINIISKVQKKIAFLRRNKLTYMTKLRLYFGNFLVDSELQGGGGGR